jgi:hypothetical protein
VDPRKEVVPKQGRTDKMEIIHLVVLLLQILRPLPQHLLPRPFLLPMPMFHPISINKTAYQDRTYFRMKSRPTKVLARVLKTLPDAHHSNVSSTGTYNRRTSLAGTVGHYLFYVGNKARDTRLDFKNEFNGNKKNIEKVSQITTTIASSITPISILVLQSVMRWE